MRKLVTVRNISALTEIHGADAIETATIDGWEVVVKKGEFKVGDACVYFEIDSCLPLTDSRFAFLEKGSKKFRSEGHEYARLRTIRLRGQLSQGLALPLADFPELNDVCTYNPENLAGLIGVVIYDPPVPAQLAGKVKGYFPGFIKKTDEERIQNMPEVLFDESDPMYEESIKLDGTSMTVFHNQGEIGVCSRNLQIIESPENTLWSVARETKLIDALTRNGSNVAVQGELIGPGIQGNNEDLKAPEFRIFNVWDIDGQRYLSYDERFNLLRELRELGATALEVPIRGLTRLGQFNGNIGMLLKYAEGASLNPAKPREGLVFKRVDGRLSFKAISNAYLLRDKS